MLEGKSITCSHLPTVPFLGLNISPMFWGRIVGLWVGEQIPGWDGDSVGPMSF